MDDAMSVLANETGVMLGGEYRLLCPDLNMAALLYEAVGEHWLLWLAERWLGAPVMEGNKTVGRRLAPVKPAELAMVLHALLQTDRETSAERGAPRVETESAIRRTITLTNIQDIQQAVAKAILQCFVSPGEGVEFVVRADGEAPGSGRAKQNGTGKKSSTSRRN